MPTSASTARATSASVKPSVLEEDHRLALQQRQRAHCAADHVANVAAIEVDRLRDKGLIVERRESMFRSPVLEREVPGDPKQEGAQRPASRVEPVGISEKPHEHVLGDVLRGRRAGHTPCEPIDGVLVLVEGGLELSVGHVVR